MTPVGRAPAPTDPAATDEELVGRFAGGDERAFTELVARYQRRVYGICYRYFRDASDAEDAAQEAFVALYRRAGSFAGSARFSTWMYRVAVNACNDLARRRSRRPQPAGVAVADLPDVVEAEDVLARRELAAELREALATLEPATRDAVLWHTVLGVPYQDIADRQGVALGTVKSRIHRGHARLATVLRGQEPSGALQPPTA